MRNIRVISLILVGSGLGMMAASLLWREGGLLGGGGEWSLWSVVLGVVGVVAMTGGWLIMWVKRVGEVVGETGRLQGLRREIEREALRLERERVALRQERAAFFADDEFPDFPRGLSADGESVVGAAVDPADWDARDAKVLELMREESERLFRRLLDNTYIVEGAFDPQRLGDDLIGLVESVARVYQPDSEHPLLETSVERLLRAVNRASVQMLVHLEQLPLDVKSYNLRETYQWVRSGTRYYGYYKKVEPYWNYARPLYHLGRLALGTNPITIGVGWAVSELVKQGSVSMAHSYALRLLHDTVRIVGNEAAGIFGGDYRHRDPAWIYGMEVVALTVQAPASQERLTRALREVSALTLRSEYDRIYLYGCLSGRMRPRPERFPGRTFLSVAERHEIARRLERHATGMGLAGDTALLERWKTAAGERLGLQLQLGDSTLQPSPGEATRNAVRALASFLIHFKGMEPAEVRPHVAGTGSAGSVETASFEEVWDAIAAEPPMLFEIPCIGPGTAEVTRFLEDLLDLEAGHAPRFPESSAVIEETAGYFREDPAVWRDKLRARYKRFLLGDLIEGGGQNKVFPNAAAPLLLGVLNEDEKVRFFYGKVALVPAGVASEFLPGRALLLCGTDQRLLLLAVSEEQADLVWSGRRAEVKLERQGGVLSDDCSISGGRWLVDAETAPQAIVIAGRKLQVYDTRFAAVIAWHATAG